MHDIEINAVEMQALPSISGFQLADCIKNVEDRKLEGAKVGVKMKKVERIQAHLLGLSHSLGLVVLTLSLFSSRCRFFDL